MTDHQRTYATFRISYSAFQKFKEALDNFITMTR